MPATGCNLPLFSPGGATPVPPDVVSRPETVIFYYGNALGLALSSPRASPNAMWQA
jgi:hypothetical protein